MNAESCACGKKDRGPLVFENVCKGIFLHKELVKKKSNYKDEMDTFHKMKTSKHPSAKTATNPPVRYPHSLPSSCHIPVDFLWT